MLSLTGPVQVWKEMLHQLPRKHTGIGMLPVSLYLDLEVTFANSPVANEGQSLLHTCKETFNK